MSLIVFFAKLTQPRFFARALESGRLQFITLVFSHFVEIARWALQIKKIPFDEHGYVPGQHVLPALAARFGRGGKPIISNSSYVKGIDNVPEEQEAIRAKKSRSTALPIAILPSGDALADSWTIAAFSNLAPIDDDFKKLLDEKLGPLSRQLFYSFALNPANRNIWNGICTEGQSWWWKIIWHLVAGNHIAKLMSKLFRTNEPETVNACREELIQVVARCDEYLKARKGKFLGGDQIGVADIALASLMAPLVSPPEYCKGKYTKWFDQIEKQDPKLVAELSRWRDTQSGQYSLRMYREFRYFEM